MILLINACVRKDSRTKRLADRLVNRLRERESRGCASGEVPAMEEIVLSEAEFPAVGEAFLAKRDRASQEADFSDPVFAPARAFAAADTIVIAAPSWDFSFPASLKQYIEQINVVGLTFHYPDGNVPQGLCRAKELYYVTTAGGTGHTDEYGYGYVRDLAAYFYGIPQTHLIKAEGLDIAGADADAIMEAAEHRIDEMFGSCPGEEEI